MVETLLGKKVGMTQVFDGKGEAVPVTVIHFEDAVVVDKKTDEKDGYTAVRIGVGDVKKPKRVSKAVKGIYKNEKNKKDLPLKKRLKEIRMPREEADKFNVGDTISLDGVFKEGDFIDASGITKGKGFQGVMKKHNFHGGPGGHGSMHHRLPGSVGASSYPSRVFKNQKMPGRLGGDKVTAQNLVVEKVDAENKVMLVRGAVPGAKNGMVLVKKSVKKEKGGK